MTKDTTTTIPPPLPLPHSAVTTTTTTTTTEAATAATATTAAAAAAAAAATTTTTTNTILAAGGGDGDGGGDVDLLPSFLSTSSNIIGVGIGIGVVGTEATGMGTAVSNSSSTTTTNTTTTTAMNRISSNSNNNNNNNNNNHQYYDQTTSIVQLLSNNNNNNNTDTDTTNTTTTTTLQEQEQQQQHLSTTHTSSSSSSSFTCPIVDPMIYFGTTHSRLPQYLQLVVVDNDDDDVKVQQVTKDTTTTTGTTELQQQQQQHNTTTTTTGRGNPTTTTASSSSGGTFTSPNRTTASSSRGSSSRTHLGGTTTPTTPSNNAATTTTTSAASSTNIQQQRVQQQQDEADSAAGGNRIGVVPMTTTTNNNNTNLLRNRNHSISTPTILLQQQQQQGGSSSSSGLFSFFQLQQQQQGRSNGISPQQHHNTNTSTSTSILSLQQQQQRLRSPSMIYNHTNNNDTNNNNTTTAIVPDWRSRDGGNNNNTKSGGMKTVGVGLIMALNLGNDAPPDHNHHPYNNSTNYSTNNNNIINYNTNNMYHINSSNNNNHHHHHQYSYYRHTKASTMFCWINPYHYKRHQAKDIIADRLEQQYTKLQSRASSRTNNTTTTTTTNTTQPTRNNSSNNNQNNTNNNNNNNNNALKFRRALDPTIEDVRSLCTRLRNQARQDRIVLHYNGYGVPKPTNHGEIWLFDRNKTEYIPLPILDIKTWIGKPVLMVLDCNNAGVVIPYLTMATDDTVSTAGGSSTVTIPIRSPPSNVSMNNNNNNTSSNINFYTNNISDFDGLARQLPSVSATTGPQQQQQQQPLSLDEQANMWVRDTMVLCACSENEWLPMHPDYPTDIFTCCLTTPIPMALRWFIHRNQKSIHNLHPDTVDSIPGVVHDRKTPLGELNWIFTTVTDTIAWNVLPKTLFKLLFRKDLMVASMFRNFLLADRILSSMNCTPVSFPPLPKGTAHHPLWQAWDLACETLLFQLIQDGILGNHLLKKRKDTKSSSRNAGGGSSSTSSNSTTGGSHEPINSVDYRNDGNNNTADERSTNSTEETQHPQYHGSSPSTRAVRFREENEHPMNHNIATVTDSIVPVASKSSVSSPFFSEQLAAFEIWLEFAEIHKLRLKNGPTTLDPPEHLPVVVQVLLGVAHRVRALTLLKRFLELGPWAINMSLSLGIFPYVLKLLQSPEYKCLLVSIWASIISFDKACRVDIVKDGVTQHFVQHLMWGLNNNSNDDVTSAAKERTMAAFVLAAVCYEYIPGQNECIRLNLHGSCCALLSSYEKGEHAHDVAVEMHLPPPFRLWLCLCLANMVKANKATQTEAYATGVHKHLAVRIHDKSPDVRAAVCYAFGSLVEAQPKSSSRAPTSFHDLTQQLHAANTARQFQSPGMLQPGIVTSSGVQGSIPVAFGGQQLQPSLQPSFTQQPGLPNLQLRPQPIVNAMTMLQGQSMNAGPAQGGGLFWNQAQLHHAAHGLPYNMQSQPSNIVPNSLGYPSGFLVGSGPMLTPSGQPTLMNLSTFPSHPHVPMIPMTEQRPMAQPTIYENRTCLELDLSSSEVVLLAMNDGSVIVRYEAIVALGVATAKYLDAFVIVANELSLSTLHPHSTTLDTSIPENRNVNELTVPRGLEAKDLIRFKKIWVAIRSMQRHESFPSIAKVANSVVNIVHESLFIRKTESQGKSDSIASKSNRLSDISEDNVPVANPTVVPISSVGRIEPKTRNELRRVSSETIHSHSKSKSMEENATSIGTPFRNTNSSNYSVPKSQFYNWKKDTFLPLDESSDELDPLSPSGIRRQYQDRRTSIIREHGVKLAERYICLAPKPPKPIKQSIEMMLEQEEDEDILIAAEVEISTKKKELEYRESFLCNNQGVTMTSLLSFHPSESYIMACGDKGSVSLWNTDSGQRCRLFENDNSKASRMTTSCWINPESTSHFMVGCDDGTVRIWSNVLDNIGENHYHENSSNKPCLLSSFHAVPMDAGQWGSGLITDWQPYSGTLIAGGNSKYILCWDVQAEKVNNKLETNSDAYVTTLTTAWDEDTCNNVASTFHGIGKDVIVSGFSDGCIKLHDLRKNPTGSRPKFRVNASSEHKSWVVTTSFTSYANRYELISGTISGEVKAWDLRMLSCIRTLDVQRSTMTTLAVHRKIPIIATGSDAQFIKMVGLDGDTLQVLRYHETLKANHKFGPISCLAFHPYKDLLAAGATDNFVGLYSRVAKKAM